MVRNVPDLEVFNIFDGNSIKPLKLLTKVLLPGNEDVCSVDPSGS